MSSTLKKERIVYFSGILLFVLMAISLCFPYITWGVYTNNQLVNVADSVTYLGWQLFGLSAYYKGTPAIGEFGQTMSYSSISKRAVTPIGTESMFVIFTIALFLVALLLACIDGFALYENYKNGKSFGKKLINIMHIGFAIISVAIVIVYVPYVNYLNNHVFTSTNTATVAASAKAWSSFAFKSLSGVETKMAAGPFLIAAFGVISAFVSIIMTMKIQDNSILYPYKKRHVWASVLCLAVCVGVFFLPLIDYYFSTYQIVERSSTLMTLLFQGKPASANDAILNGNALERLASYFSTGVGWDSFLYGSGDIAGYYKVVFSFMFVIAGIGIIFSLANILAAIGIIKFNFNRGYLTMITGTIMGFCIALWAASLLYSVGSNVNLGLEFNKPDFYNYYLRAYPAGQFPQTVCTLGAWLCMVPGVAGFVGTKLLCSYDD